jgi:hypothetical protein
MMEAMVREVRSHLVPMLLLTRETKETHRGIDRDLGFSEWQRWSYGPQEREQCSSKDLEPLK